MAAPQTQRQDAAERSVDEIKESIERLLEREGTTYANTSRCSKCYTGIEYSDAKLHVSMILGGGAIIYRVRDLRGEVLFYASSTDRAQTRRLPGMWESHLRAM